MIQSTLTGRVSPTNRCRSFEVPEFAHPYTNYTVADAVDLVESTTRLFGGDMPKSLQDVRTRIVGMLQRCKHQWITGYAALDVLDAVIDGHDLRQYCRLP